MATTIHMATVATDNDVHSTQIYFYFLLSLSVAAKNRNILRKLLFLREITNEQRNKEQKGKGWIELKWKKERC
jgi:hypothetical protein